MLEQTTCFQILKTLENLETNLVLLPVTTILQVGLCRVENELSTQTKKDTRAKYLHYLPHAILTIRLLILITDEPRLRFQQNAPSHELLKTSRLETNLISTLEHSWHWNSPAAVLAYLSD